MGLGFFGVWGLGFFFLRSQDLFNHDVSHLVLSSFWITSLHNSGWRCVWCNIIFPVLYGSPKVMY